MSRINVISPVNISSHKKMSMPQPKQLLLMPTCNGNSCSHDQQEPRHHKNSASRFNHKNAWITLTKVQNYLINMQTKSNINKEKVPLVSISN